MSRPKIPHEIVIHDGRTLVKSATKPGIWYEVTDVCPCDGYTHRHTCSHMDEVEARIMTGNVARVIKKLLYKTADSL